MNNSILILFFICFSSSLFPVGPHKGDSTVEETKSALENIISNQEISAEKNFNETDLSDKESSLNLIKNNPEKKFISIKRFKNKYSSDYLIGLNNFKGHKKEINSLNHCCYYVNLPYLKFLRVTKMLC